MSVDTKKKEVVGNLRNGRRLPLGWGAEPIDRETRLRAYGLPNPKVEPSFECFEPFGFDSSR